MPTAEYLSNRRLFQKLTDSGRMPQTVFISDHVEQMRMESGKFPVVRCKVEAVNEEKTNYLPYQSICEAGTKYRYDAEVSLTNKQQYEFWLLNGFESDWDVLTATAASSPDEYVQRYERFTRDVYTAVPATDAMNAIREQFVSYVYDNYNLTIRNNGLPLNKRLEIVRSYLWDTCSYTIAPGSTPEGMDYAEYFLLYNHKGFCAHYATAAVLLCRMCGIPARYCQGYVMTQNNLVEAVGDGNHLYQIPDEQAHAWAEIYVDGYGWIPYEFTETVSASWHSGEAPIEETDPALTTTAGTQTAASASATTRTTASTGQPVSGTDGNDPAAASSGSSAVRFLLIALLSIVAAAVFVLLYRAFHYAVVRKRRAAMLSRDANAAAETSYHFLVHLLAVLDIRQGRLSHEEFAEKAEKCCKLLAPQSMQRAAAIAQEAVFRKTGTTQEAAGELREIAEGFAKTLYQQSGKLRRFLLRWILHDIA